MSKISNKHAGPPFQTIYNLILTILMMESSNLCPVFNFLMDFQYKTLKHFFVFKLVNI